eukprot:15894955-Heterocapsa_arctica.AAC.1
MAALSAFDEVAHIAEEWGRSALQMLTDVHLCQEFAAFDLKQMSNTFFTHAIAPQGFEDIEHCTDCNLDEGDFYCGEADLGGVSCGRTLKTATALHVHRRRMHNHLHIK